MTRWMDFLERANPDYLRARELGNSYNDWLAPGDDDTPHELLATAYWAYDAALMAEIADATGRADDAAGYRALWSKIRSGATTIWERWDGWTAERGFQSAWMNSFNHYALGSVGEWLYRFALGIDQEPGTAGFGRLLVRPHPGGTLTWARGSYRSVRGPITSGWQRDGGTFTFRLDLPPNVTASVRIPSDAPGAVRDGTGAPPAAVAGFPGGQGSREAVFAVGSGSHQFTGPALTESFS
jgi:alpha-L-rhamnosidase